MRERLYPYEKKLHLPKRFFILLADWFSNHEG